MPWRHKIMIIIITIRRADFLLLQWRRLTFCDVLKNWSIVAKHEQVKEMGLRESTMNDRVWHQISKIWTKSIPKPALTWTYEGSFGRLLSYTYVPFICWRILI